MAREHIGLSRRELERELNWLLRSLPDDPQKMAKLLAHAIVTLLEKNNARIAEDLQQDSAPDVEEDF
jgi:hypothetical protein